MTTVPTTCPLCGHAGAAPLYESKVAMPNVSVAAFHLAVGGCPACGFVYQTSAYAPGYDELMEKAYAAFDVNGIFPFPERSPKNLEPLNILLRHLPADRPLSVLEIGSNRGDLLYLLREQRPHYNVLGVEPTAFANLEIPTIRGGYRPGLLSSTFDVVVMKHVLEHLKDPVACIRSFHDLVRPGGWLYVEVPDLDLSLDHVVEDFIPDHVGHFTHRTLAGILAKGFVELECERGTFLRIMARRDDAGMPAQDGIDDLDRVAGKFAAFHAAKRDGLAAIAGRAAQGGRVAFYGVSYYFARLMRELSGSLDPARCFFIDDNMRSDVEPSFGLSRIAPDALGPSDLAVLCTNNFRVQERMAEQLAGRGCQVAVMLPWRGAYPSAAAFVAETRK